MRRTRAKGEERERGAASDWAIAPKDKQQQELMPIKWEF